jgi:phosphoribosylanthranilate isomerase
MKTKICGITRMVDIAAINTLETKPDYIGFVFAGSKRKVTPDQAREMRVALCGDIQTVGVFVDEPLEAVLSLVQSGAIQIVQLHGNEDENYIAELKSQTDAPVIKAISVEKLGDTQAWENSAADFLLLDHAGGGTGSTFDWQLIGQLKKPFFLAGGLTPENVAQAIEISPFAVDVSSGVEISHGVKCIEKIKNFMKGANK